MQGWTFEFVPRPLGQPPPWDYQARARELAGRARRVLDLGTGGGEVLAGILGSFAGQALATEEWRPNVTVAARRLRGVAQVLHASSLAVPLAGESVDLVLDRHEALDPAEVARVLRPGGRVLTQQVHPNYHAELRPFFPRMTRSEPHHITYPAGFERAGLVVADARAHEQPMAYPTLGHLAYEIAAAPWSLPDFDLEADLDALLRVEAELGGPQGIVLFDRRYLVEAYRPAPNPFRGSQSRPGLGTASNPLIAPTYNE